VLWRSPRQSAWSNPARPVRPARLVEPGRPGDGVALNWRAWAPMLGLLAAVLSVAVDVRADETGRTGRAERASERLDGLVIGVADGDTLKLLDAQRREWRIRLGGVDAPERGQPFGGTSKRHLAGLVFSRQVQARCGKVDRYGREVCQVLVDGVDVGLAQIEAGMAWYYGRYGAELPADRRGRYEAAQTAAKAERRGLWADAQPRAPWDWRADKAGRQGIQ